MLLRALQQAKAEKTGPLAAQSASCRLTRELHSAAGKAAAADQSISLHPASLREQMLLLVVCLVARRSREISTPLSAESDTVSSCGKVFSCRSSAAVCCGPAGTPISRHRTRSFACIFILLLRARNAFFCILYRRAHRFESMIPSKICLSGPASLLPLAGEEAVFLLLEPCLRGGIRGKHSKYHLCENQQKEKTAREP